MADRDAETQLGRGSQSRLCIRKSLTGRVRDQKLRFSELALWESWF